MRRITLSIFLCFLGLLVSASTFAVPVGYTSRAAFDTALGAAGLGSITLDFDSTAAGTTVASGDTLGDLVFSYDFGGVNMAVTDGAQFGGGGPFDTTSAPNFLGTDDGDIFQSGDDFDLSFAATNAIGMYFISADFPDPDCAGDAVICDDDIALRAADMDVLLDIDAIEDTLPDGSNVFFLGVIDTATPFTGVSITSFCCGFFLFNVDDIVRSTAEGTAPEPSTALLLVIALAGMAGFGRRQQTRR